MSETVILAIVAVAGTSLGAAISPLIGVLRDSLSMKSDAKSERLKAAASFGETLVKYARMVPGNSEAMRVRQAHTMCVEARFDLARHLPKGAGQVDRFAESAIAEMENGDALEWRLAMAERAAFLVLDWARGDVPARSLKPFTIMATSDGGFESLPKPLS